MRSRRSEVDERRHDAEAHGLAVVLHTRVLELHSFKAGVVVAEVLHEIQPQADLLWHRSGVDPVRQQENRRGERLVRLTTFQHSRCGVDPTGKQKKQNSARRYTQ